MTEKPEQAVYTLVVGLGKTGLSVVRYLYALGERVVVVDSRDIPPGLDTLKNEFSDVELHTGRFDKTLFANAHRIVVSPGVPLSEPVLLDAKDKNIEITGDIDLFAHEVQAPVIGITGSNGKSTVTTLLASMASRTGLNAVACGNIGLPVLDSLDDDVELYVLELSSFQLETLERLPMKAAVVLNISADHLDRYESITTYALSKQHIYANAEALIVNKDDDLAGGDITSDKNIVAFTLKQPQNNEFGLSMSEDNVVNLCHGEQVLMPVDKLKLKGLHNLQNALAALALGHVIGLPLDSMIDALKSFTGLPHRTQFVASINKVDWINDSKATNVGAAIAALTGLPGKKILIAGGEAKDADFSELGEVINTHCRAVILLGRDAKKISSVISDEVTVRFVNDMQSAVSVAHSIAKINESVLLAPACASFDMFDNFEHRGEVFIRAVEDLCVAVSASDKPNPEVLS